MRQTGAAAVHASPFEPGIVPIRSTVPIVERVGPWTLRPCLLNSFTPIEE